MHASLQELTGLRDHEPSDAVVAQHVANCADCQAELQRLASLRSQLGALPDFAPPAAAWRAIVQRLAPAPAVSLPGPRPSRRSAAVAAALLPLCALTLFWTLQRGDTIAPAARPVANIDALVARSQQLESMLQQLPPRPAVEHAATSATIDALQARIQLLDSALSTAPAGVNARPDTQRMWNQRVQLMNSLVGMRYAEAVRVGYQSTSHEGDM